MKVKRKGKKVQPSPPQTAANPPPPPPADSDSLSILNLLPAAIFAIVAALSFQDREVLAYMITKSFKTTTTSVHEELKLNKLKKIYSLHKPPVFDCECFECYKSFWFRWDTSANHEVIHQAIEAFEEHLSSDELEMKRNRRGKKKDKLPFPHPMIPVDEDKETVSERIDERPVEMKWIVMVDEAAAAAGGHKGFARKLLLDVLGVFNSPLWNL